MPPRPRFRRTDWLDLGLSTLAADGPDALKLDAICVRAGLSKGSFYHHFADHGAFLEALAQHWADQAVAVLRDGPATAQGLSLAPEVETGMRALSQRDPFVAEIVEQIAGERVQTLTDSYVERFDLIAPRAAQFARLELGVFHGGQGDPALRRLLDEMIAAYLRPAKPVPKHVLSENEDQPSLFPLTL